MKKIFIIIIFIALLQSQLIIINNKNDNKLKEAENITAISGPDTSDIYINNFMSNYFYNLKNNIGNNWFGSCGFVSLGMLLSYYDAYYNDDIIAEDFEVKSSVDNDFALIENIAESPGIKNDSVYISSIIQNPSPNISEDVKNEIGFQNYFNMVLSGTDEDGFYLYQNFFKYYLIRYAYYHSLWYNNNSFGMTDDNLASILYNYLYNNIGLMASDYLFYRMDNDIEYWTKRYISMGYPVILGLEKGSILTNNYSGHFVVAYDYDSITDTIYANFGYGEGYTHLKLDYNGYERVSIGIAVQVSPYYQHQCSDNYFSSSNLYLCACDFSYDSRHNCDYCYLYSPSEVSHIAYCSCGNYSIGVHESDIYFPYSANKHKSTCYCGYVYYSSHNFRIVMESGRQYKKCLDCGAMFIHNGAIQYGIGGCDASE